VSITWSKVLRVHADESSAYYGVSLNTPIILSTIGFSGGPTVYKQLMNTAVGNLIVVLAGAIPGYCE
jgi:PHS family inorganic phosphate transporter-like MFS transporter